MFGVTDGLPLEQRIPICILSGAGGAARLSFDVLDTMMALTYEIERTCTVNNALSRLKHRLSHAAPLCSL